MRRGSRKAVVGHRLRLVERLDGHARSGAGDFGGHCCGSTCSRARGVGGGAVGRGSPLYRYECRAAQGRQSRQARAEETEELGSGPEQAGVTCAHARVRPSWVHRTRSASRSAAAARHARDASSPRPGCPRASTSARPAARAPPPASTRRRPAHRPKTRLREGDWRARSGRSLVRASLRVSGGAAATHLQP